MLAWSRDDVAWKVRNDVMLPIKTKEKMLEKIRSKIEHYPKVTAFLAGGCLSFAFAPYFFWPLLASLGVFAYQVKHAKSIFQAKKIGYLFGFGFYLFNLYWISVGVSVYASEFWWAIPFALLGLPAFLAIYTTLLALCLYSCRKAKLYLNSFVLIWIIFEFLRSYLFTGFPWSLIGYSVAFSDIIIQSASLVGTYGLGLIVLFSFGSICYLLEEKYKKFFISIVISLSIWSCIFIYGSDRLDKIPTSNTAIKLRLVQPSIQQTEKWSIEKFWENFYVHRDLSVEDRESFMPDLILWPESAVVAPPTITQVLGALRNVVVGTNVILVTGGVTNNLLEEDRKRDKHFASIYALKETGGLIFDYHKSHLVPFGEYVPLSDILPVKKLTPGIEPYSPGKTGFIVKLDDLNLKIRPLLCYEIIFPDEVRMSNKDADFIMNLTNDAYYGNTSGPYQHFYMARMRSVENGMPLVRVANNGITGIFDPLGRIIVKSNINDVTYINGYLPSKINNVTLFSSFGYFIVYIYIGLSFILIYLLHRKKKHH